MSGSPRPRISLVGAGRVGGALAVRLDRAGYRILTIVSRRLSGARRVARLARAAGATRSLRRLPGDAGAIVVAVPDGAVRSVATSLSERGDWTGRVVLHTCGSLGPEALAPLAGRGAATGGLHPLQTFPGGADDPPALRGVHAAVDGDPAAVRLARRMARDLGMVPVRPDPARRAGYHLAAALASNHVVALMDFAVGALEEAGLDRRQALAALLPLLRGTVEGLEREGLPGALTGPVARGDRGTVAAHLDALEAMDPDLGRLYRALSRRALALAERSGLPPSSVRSLRRLLARRPRS
jgi:predicted short-subunit dehydrogenase-like oxidoreductase (DUF2520 family)